MASNGLLAALLLLLLFLTLSPGRVTAEPCPQDASQRGQLTPDGYCICPSGRFNLEPTNCDGTVQPGSVCPFPEAPRLNTSVVGSMDVGNSLVAVDSVQLALLSPFYLDRMVKKIVVNTDVPLCRYPGHFVKSLDEETCSDYFTGVFPVSTLVNNCSLTASSTDTHQSYSGKIFMEVVDSLGSIRDIPIFRTTKAYLRFSLLLPTFFTVRVTDEEVHLAPYLQAAVTEQRFDLISHPVISVQVVASLQWPYVIQEGSTLTGPPGITGELSSMDSSKCGSTAPGSSCFQRFNFDIHATQGIRCNLTGVYTAHFNMGCRTTPSLCPLINVPGAGVATFAFTLISPVFCTPVQIDVEITQTVTSYQDQARTIQKNAFLEGQRGFFFVDLTSNVNVDSVAILSVTYQNGADQSPGAPVTAFFPDAPALATSTAFQVISVNSTTIGFAFDFVVNQDGEEFDPSIHLFDASAADYFLMRLSIWISVSYPVTLEDRRRGVHGDEQVLVKTNIVIERPSSKFASGAAAATPVNLGWLLASSATAGLLLVTRRWWR